MQQKEFLGFSAVGFHKINYYEWGSEHEDVIICVHGLTRNGHDFDQLASKLSEYYRVVCPDLPGRGASDWLVNPALYNQAQYVADLTALIALQKVTSLTWIGTSLGGLLGMYLAAQPHSPIQKLILNDIGPQIPRAALNRIAKYSSNQRTFASLHDAEQYFRSVYKDCEPLSDELWSYKTKHSVQLNPNGLYTLAYDPAIGANSHKFWFFDIKLWDVWARIHCPVLILKGANSDVLTDEIAEKMEQTDPQAKVVTIPNCGHAPMLMTTDQINIISDWISSTPYAI